jgi:hypothetical protein
LSDKVDNNIGKLIKMTDAFRRAQLALEKGSGQPSHCIGRLLGIQHHVERFSAQQLAATMEVNAQIEGFKTDYRDEYML